VIFDCDSTLVSVEGIDLLAGPHAEAVADLTDRAMRGDVPLEEVYARRLDLIRPDRAAVEEVGRDYVKALVPGARETVEGLQADGIDVWIVSGGLTLAVAAVGAELGVPGERVHAVDLEFGSDGVFQGFDPTQPLARSGGKPDLVRSWGDRLARPSLMVGDGSTDLEVRAVVEGFAAFTGVVSRPTVAAEADFVLPGPSLEGVFALAVGDSGPRQTELIPLFERGRSLISSRKA
jgi:phosphoserine phosphatase